MGSDWIQAELPEKLVFTNNLFSSRDHLTIVEKLLNAGQRIENELNEYLPSDIRDDLKGLKEKCQPHMLLRCFIPSLQIFDREMKVFEVKSDLRENKIEDDFLAYEFHGYEISELTKSKLLQGEGTAQIVLDVMSCHVSVVLSYFKILGFFSIREIDEAQVFCTEKVGDGGARYEQYCKNYFSTHTERGVFLNNLLSAINGIDSSHHKVDVGAHMAPSSVGFVYFVRNGELFKIGITENLLRRMGELVPDEILNCVRCSNFKELEREIHSVFKEVRLPQTEYFRLNESQVQQVHRMIAEKAVN